MISVAPCGTAARIAARIFFRLPRSGTGTPARYSAKFFAAPLLFARPSALLDLTFFMRAMLLRLPSDVYDSATSSPPASKITDVHRPPFSGVNFQSMNSKYSAACLFLFFSLSSHANAQSTGGQELLVLSKRAHTLAIVDPASLKVFARVPVGNDPHEVIASADGKTAYVSNYGFGAFNTLTPVDLVRQAALPAIDLGALRGPHGLAFAGGKVWFTAESAKAVGSYDPQANKVDWILGTGQNRTHMIFVSQDLKRIVTSNVSSGTVSIIEKTAGAPPGPPPGAPNPSSVAGVGASPRRFPGPPGRDWSQTIVPVGGGSEGFDVSLDGKEI